MHKIPKPKLPLCSLHHNKYGCFWRRRRRRRRVQRRRSPLLLCCRVLVGLQNPSSTLPPYSPVPLGCGFIPSPLFCRSHPRFPPANHVLSLPMNSPRWRSSPRLNMIWLLRNL
ncbi:hypothetical protein MA16_Dca011204 [Dendrobium catenatum]|uniref:Uncharacterized protein n=1 Tax=Dendrobium catenatum TaxID=906689 RepID=A0A2I0VW47_9ASPA|nr:hypothetical protein MA16_Dca011204 [Dendrobium catenatum]